MPKTRAQKELTLADLTKKLQDMKAVVFSSNAGLTVKDTTDLRRQLRAEGVDLLVAKKTLLRKALTELKLDPTIVDSLQGGFAMAFGYGDEVTPAKLLQKFSKDHPMVTLMGGIVEGSFVDAARVTQLAKLPGRQELIAQTVWTIKAPLTGLVNVMAGNIRGLITVLSAIKDSKPA